MSERLHIVYEDTGENRILRTEQEEILDLLNNSFPAIRRGEIAGHDIYDDSEKVTRYTPENIDQAEALLRARLEEIQ